MPRAALSERDKVTCSTSPVCAALLHCACLRPHQTGSPQRKPEALMCVRACSVHGLCMDVALACSTCMRDVHVHAMRTRSCKSGLKSWSESARQRWSHSVGSRVTWSGASSTTCATSRCPARLTRQLPMACTSRCAVHTSPAAKLRLVLSKHHAKEANAVPLSPFSESLRLRRRCARQFTVGTAVRKAKPGLACRESCCPDRTFQL